MPEITKDSITFEKERPLEPREISPDSITFAKPQKNPNTYTDYEENNVGVKDILRNDPYYEDPEKDIKKLRGTLEISRQTGISRGIVHENYDQIKEREQYEDSWYEQFKKNAKIFPQHVVKSWGGLLRMFGEKNSRDAIDELDRNFDNYFGGMGGDRIKDKLSDENSFWPILGEMYRKAEAFTELHPGKLPATIGGLLPGIRQAKKLEAEALAEGGSQVARGAQEKIEKGSPRVAPGTFKYYVSGATQSLMNNAALYVPAIALKKPQIVIAGIGAQAIGEKYQDVREEGFDINTATLSALTAGGTEAIPEMIPLGKAYFKPSMGFIKRILTAELTEITSEEITTISQILADKMILDKNTTLPEAWEQIKETAIVTAIATGPLSAGVEVMQRVGGTQDGGMPAVSDPAFDPIIENMRQEYDAAKQKAAEVEAGIRPADEITPEMQATVDELESRGLSEQHIPRLEVGKIPAELTQADVETQQTLDAIIQGQSEDVFADAIVAPAVTEEDIGDIGVLERRQNEQLRQKIDTLIEKAATGDQSARDELHEVYHDSKGSPLLSGLGYRKVDKAANQLFLDLDNFKLLNDIYTYDGADQILKHVGDAMHEEFDRIDAVAARTMGDEFEATHDSDDKLRFVAERLTKRLESAKIEIQMPDGSIRIQEGIGLSYGTGKTRADAVANLKKHKEARKEAGLRFEREEVPADFRGVAGELGAGEQDTLRRDTAAERLKTPPLEEDEFINSITREEAGRLMAAGDLSVVEHIQQGIEEGIESPVMEDAIRNQLLREKSKSLDLSKEERLRIGENLSKSEKAINRVLRPEEGGFLYIPSKADIDAAVKRVSEAVKDPRQAFNDLVQIGQSIYIDGKTSVRNFADGMRQVLGKAWDAFSDIMGRVYEAVRAFNERLGERGAVGPFEGKKGPKPTGGPQKIGLPEQKPTVQRQVKQATGQMKTDLDFIREDKALSAAFTKAAQAARKAFSEGNKAGVAKERARMQKIIENAKAKRLEITERKRIIRNMKKVKSRLPKMPAEFAKPIREFIDSINLVNLSDAKRSSLVEIKNMLESNELAAENVLSKQELAELERLGRSNVKDFTMDELRQIHDAVMHYAKLASEYNRLRIANQKIEMAAALATIDKELKPEKQVNSTLIKTQKSAVRKTIDKLETWVDLVIHDQKAPDALLESMAGRDSVIYNVLYRQVNQGAKKSLAYRQEAQDRFHDSLEGFAKRNKIKDVMKWIKQKVTINLGQGKSIQMTRDERMSFFRHSLNPDNRQAITNEKGGVGFKGSDEFKNKPLKLTESELDAIVESMTPAELEFAGNPVKDLFDAQGQELSDTYKQKNGLDLETLENYFPKEVLPRERAAGDLETDFEMEKFTNKFLRIGIEKGMTKARQGSRKAVYISGLTYEINKSINRAASYIGLEIPISNAARLYYNKDFQTMIDSRYGEKVRKYIEKYLRDVAGEMQNYDAVESLTNVIKNNLSVAYLAISPFVMAKQTASLPLYSVYIEPQYLLEGIANATIHPIATKEKHKANSPYYRARLEGASERDVADVFKSKSLRKIIPDSRKTLKEWGMSGIQLFDLAAVTPGMEAGYIKVMTELENGKLSGITKETLGIEDTDIPNLSPARKQELAYEFAEWVIEKTQPQFAPQQRSQMSRGSVLSKMFTMFGSFTNRAYNLLGSTYANARRTNSAQDWGIFARAAINVLVINTLIIMTIDRLRDELYDRESPELWKSILKSWAGYVFILRDFARAGVADSIYEAELETPVSSWLQGAADSIRHTIRYIEDGKQKDLDNAIDKGLDFILSGVGVPYRMLKKLIPKDSGGKL